MCEKVQQLRRCIVVIPALDLDGILPGYVSALLERGAEQIVVVDDGSKLSCQPVFQDLETLEGCTVLRHEQNRGKGRAVKDAFQRSFQTVDNFPETVIPGSGGIPVPLRRGQPVRRRLGPKNHGSCARLGP